MATSRLELVIADRAFIASTRIIGLIDKICK